MEQNCPVCDAPMKVDRSVMDGWLLEEEYHTCPNSHYWYEYAYGGTRITIGKGEEFIMSYSDTPVEKELFAAQVDAATEVAKTAWRVECRNS